MKKAKIAELKSRLSSYLADVKKGDTIVVCERQTPIARLVPFAEDDPRVRVIEAARGIGKLGKIRPVRLSRKIDVDKILSETREDG
jgi:prevent-host-death family protein